MPGFFISLDGVDGCGKSTQIELMQAWLKSLGQQALVVRDPGGTKLGESLREILLHKQEIPLSMTAEMLLYMSSRAQLVSEVIRPAIESGTNVIADRFLIANVVYQGSAGGLAPETIWSVGEIATQGLSPDLTLLLDLDSEVAMQRVGTRRDRLESRGAEYMSKVRQGFLDESSRLGNQMEVIDASQSIQQMHEAIKRHVQTRFPTLQQN